jgi:hypothetical protein
VYDLVADDFRPSFKGSTRANTARVVDRSMRTMAGIVARTSRKSAAAGRIRCEPGRENVVGKVEHAWLTADEFAHVRRRIHSIKRYLDARLIRRDGALYMAAFFMVPVARSRGAAVSRKARTGAR